MLNAENIWSKMQNKNWLTMTKIPKISYSLVISNVSENKTNVSRKTIDRKTIERFSKHHMWMLWKKPVWGTFPSLGDWRDQFDSILDENFKQPLQNITEAITPKYCRDKKKTYSWMKT